MPSPIVHTAVGYMIYRISRQRFTSNADSGMGSFPLLLVILVLISLLPDLDAVPGLILGEMGRFHNQVTHSFIVGFVVAFFASGIISWRLGARFSLWFLILLLTYEVHIILDYFTYGERGVMLFWPFITERFISGLTIFYGVRWSEGWISIDHLVTLITESIFIVILILVVKMIERWRSNRAVSIF